MVPPAARVEVELLAQKEQRAKPPSSFHPPSPQPLSGRNPTHSQVGRYTSFEDWEGYGGLERLTRRQQSSPTVYLLVVMLSLPWLGVFGLPCSHMLYAV